MKKNLAVAGLVMAMSLMAGFVIVGVLNLSSKEGSLQTSTDVGVVELFAFVAILIGTLSASYLSACRVKNNLSVLHGAMVAKIDSVDLLGITESNPLMIRLEQAMAEELSRRIEAGELPDITRATRAKDKIISLLQHYAAVCLSEEATQRLLAFVLPVITKDELIGVMTQNLNLKSPTGLPKVRQDCWSFLARKFLEGGPAWQLSGEECVALREAGDFIDNAALAFLTQQLEALGGKWAETAKRWRSEWAVQEQKSRELGNKGFVAQTVNQPAH